MDETHEAWKKALQEICIRGKINGCGVFFETAIDNVGFSICPAVVFEGHHIINRNLSRCIIAAKNGQLSIKSCNMSRLKDFICKTISEDHENVFEKIKDKVLGYGSSVPVTISWLSYVLQCEKDCIEKLWVEDITSFNAKVEVFRWDSRKLKWDSITIVNEHDTIEKLAVEHDMRIH